MKNVLHFYYTYLFEYADYYEIYGFLFFFIYKECKILIVTGMECENNGTGIIAIVFGE